MFNSVNNSVNKSFINYIITCCNRPNTIRLGQHMFNKLHEYNVDLSNSIRGQLATIDPYYNDDNIESFLEYVILNWDKYNE